MTTTTARRWVVTARHELPRHLCRDRTPWGVHHLRPDGVARTACGLPTGDWISFWAGVPAQQHEYTRMCVACSSSVVPD